MLTHLSLFSGIGGLDLAAERAGFTTVAQCEWADYPTKVLEKHWPDVLRWRDIRTLTGDDFYARTGLRTVDVISGGFPCQPFSVAGKQKGKRDDRYLWPEMCRVIAELAPRCVVGENVPGILRIAAADVLSDLERLGYQTVVFDFEAAAVAAHHRRERVAFVAYRDNDGPSAGQERGSADAGGNDCTPREDETGEFERLRATGEHADVANARDERFEGDRPCGECIGGTPAEEWTIAGSRSLFDTASKGLSYRTDRTMGKPEPEQKPERPMRWPAEPAVGRVAHGVPNRVDRIKCLGNAVVPAQFFPIFRALNVILTEEEMQCTQ